MEFDIAIKPCSGNKTWDLSEVNLTVKSVLFVSKQIPSVDVVANVKDGVWKQEDQKKILHPFCNVKVSKFEMGLCKEVNLTVKSVLFVSKQIPSVDVVANVKDGVWKQEDQKKILHPFCNVKISKFDMGLCKDIQMQSTHGDDQMQSTHDDDQMQSTHGDDQMLSTHGNDQMQSTHGDDQIQSTHGDDQIQSTYGNDQIQSTHGDDQIQSTHGDDQIQSTHGDDQMQSTHGDDQMQSTHGDDQMQSTHGNDQIQSTHGDDQIQSTHGNDQIQSTHGMILVLVLLLSPFCSLSNATKLDDCLQTFVSGFVDNGEDLVLHCKCNCQCSHSWRWSGGPNEDDLTTNLQVLPSYKDKVNITENAPGVHEYSIILKAKATDLFSSDYTCHNGFNSKQINRSELLQHVSPPIQSTVTSTMSSPEQTKTSAMLTHKQTRTSTMSTLKPPKTSNNSKLNDGEIVGIVVGSLIVVALVVVVAVFLVNRECNPPKKEQRGEQILMNTTPHVEQDLLTLP